MASPQPWVSLGEVRRSEPESDSRKLEVGQEGRALQGHLGSERAVLSSRGQEDRSRGGSGPGVDTPRAAEGKLSS